MKKSFLFVFASMLAFAACSVNEIESDDSIQDEGHLVTLTASINTKVAVVDHKYNWQSGDVIAVFQEDGSATPITFTASSSATSSTFTAITDKTIGKYAFYPYEPANAASFEWVEDSGDDIMSIKLSGGYTYSENTLNIPMLGTISGSSITFNAIGGVIRFTVNNIPATAESFWFTATNKNIAGDFLIDASATTPTVNMTPGHATNSIYVAFTPGSASSLTFSIPVPVGTIDGFTMELLDGELDVVYSVTSTANISVERNQVITAPTWTIPAVDVITRSFTGVIVGTSYSDWSNKSGQSSSAKYAGNSAGGKDADAVNGAIQLRASSGSGIVSTTTGGLIRKVEVEWHSNTPDDRVLDIYGKQTPYMSSADLFDASARGTYIGSITKGSTAELVIPKNQYYPYVGIRSNGNSHWITSINIAWDEDNRPSLSAPLFSEDEGQIPVGTSVTLSGADGSTIYYTLDGSTPTESSTIYSAGIVVNDDVTIKAVALKNGYKISPVATRSYTVPVCVSPSFDTAEGAISSGSDVTIENNEPEAVLYYTTDGSDPDGSSSYGVAGADVVISNISSATTIKAFARKSGFKDSGIASASYTISGVATPLSNPSSITFAPNPTVFTASWANDANAVGYTWYISESSTSAGINTEDDPHGTFTVGSLDGTGASLSDGTWKLTKTQSLTIGTTYYFYVMANGDGSTYTNSGYSSPVGIIVPLVINVENITTTGSYSGSEVEFNTNSKKFGYVACMKNSANAPSGWANLQVIQLRKSASGAGNIYNKDALGSQIKNIRVYLVGSNTFSIKYGTSTAVDGGSISRPTTPTGTTQVTYNTNAGGTATATLNYYDFDISSHNSSHFQLLNGGSANYVYRIEITY